MKLGVTSTFGRLSHYSHWGLHPVSVLCADLDSMSATPSVCVWGIVPFVIRKEHHPSTSQSFLFFSR